MIRYPRQQAIRVLTRVLSDHQALDEAIDHAAAESKLPPPARAWLQEVCSGTLRWKGRLDLAIDSVALKKKPTGWLRKALLIATYQLIAQDRVQPGAVVSETVSEIKSKEGEAPAKFANACLRKLAEHGSAYRNLEADPSASPADAARWASMPEWLWRMARRDQGEEWARAYAQASLDRPVLWARMKAGFAPPPGAEPGPIEGSFRFAAGGGTVSDLPGFREGAFFIQDISSQTLVREVSNEVHQVLGEGRLSALDLCAAPGGKSAGLAWNGFQVTATDRPEGRDGAEAGSRFALLKQTLSRVAPEARVVSRNEVEKLEPQDLVWVDAPCSGSGILRRHPDVRWLRQEKEIAVLEQAQRALLQEAWAKVRPGGFLVYSVCSILKSEGPYRAQELFKTAGSSALEVREWSLVPQQAPHGDGFWAILIRKLPSAT